MFIFGFFLFIYLFRLVFLFRKLKPPLLRLLPAKLIVLEGFFYSSFIFFPSLFLIFSFSFSLSVVTLLREGRCALVTSFNCFKYMALYSIIQFTTVLILDNVNAMLSDFEYLYIDMFLILPFAFLMGKTGKK